MTNFGGCSSHFLIGLWDLPSVMPDFELVAGASSAKRLMVMLGGRLLLGLLTLGLGLVAGDTLDPS